MAVEAREQLQAVGADAGRVHAVRGVVRGAGPGVPDSVLPPSVKARVSIEAGIGLTWHRFVGDADALFRWSTSVLRPTARSSSGEFGFTAENVADAARESIAAAQR